MCLRVCEGVCGCLSVRVCACVMIVRDDLLGYVIVC